MEDEGKSIRKSQKKGCGGCLVVSCLILSPFVILMTILLARSELHQHWRWEMYREELRSSLTAIRYDNGRQRLVCTNPKILLFISGALNRLNGDWPDHSTEYCSDVDVILTFKNGASFTETMRFEKAAGAWYISLSNPHTMRADPRYFCGRLRGEPPPGFMRMISFLNNWKLRGNLDLK